MALAERKLSILTTSVAALALVAGSAMAQDAIAQGENGAVAQEEASRNGATLLDRLVLGAGEPKVAIDTPQAVTVLDQEDIDEKQATTVTDLVTGIPNVSVVGGANRVLGQNFNIRGIGQGSVAGDQGRIIVNVDGMPQFYESYRMGGFFNDPELFKRVEVLRGPASSTLYGSGALGGVINFTTKDASDFLDDDQQAILRLKLTGETNGDAYLGSTILAARLGANAELLLAGNYRAASEFEDGDGMPVSGTDFATPNGLVKGTFYLDDLQERILRVSYSQFTSDRNDQALVQLEPTDEFGTVDRLLNNRQAQIALEDSASDNPWLDYKVSLTWNNIANEQSDAKPGDLPPGFSTSPLFDDTKYGYESWRVSGENTVEMTGDNWENYFTFGAEFINQERTTEQRSVTGFHPEGRDTQYGLFIQNEFVLNDRLTLIPGVRADYQQLSSLDDKAGLPDRDEWAFSPKIAALYDLNDMFSVFGSYAHTQRFPTLDEIYSNDFSSPAPPNYSLDLEKERSNNFELGFIVSQNDLLEGGDAFDLKTTVFYNRVDDLIERRRNQNPQYVNVDEAELYGIEIEAAYDSERFFADAGFGLTVGDNLTKDIALTNVAPPELTVGAGYRMPDHGLTFGWDGRFVFKESRVPIPAGTQRNPTDVPAEKLRRDAFNVQDLYVEWAAPDDSRLVGWDARFRVENVFNTQYRDYLANDNGKGRTFKLTLAKTIGIR